MNNEMEFTPELKAARRAQVQKKRKIRKLIVKGGISVFFIIIALMVVFLLLFRVRNITVKGTTSYTNAEIIEKSGIETGENLFFIDYEEAEERIEQLLPYCDNVKIKKKLPSTIVINVEQAKETYSVMIGTGIFAITNEDMKVLEVTGEYRSDIITVEGHSDVIAYEVGKELPFTNEVGDDPVKEALTEVSQAITDSEFEGVEYINIEDDSKIYLIYDDRIIIRVGDTNNILQKLALAKKALDEENQLSTSQYGELDISEIKKAVFAPKDYKNMDDLISYDESKAAAQVSEDTDKNAEENSNEEELSENSENTNTENEENEAA